MQAWVMLGLAGLAEIGWVIGLKYSEGFTRVWWSGFTVVSLLISMVLLGLAAKTLPIGTAYAVWTGIGAVGAAIAGLVVLVLGFVRRRDERVGPVCGVERERRDEAAARRILVAGAGVVTDEHHRERAVQHELRTGARRAGRVARAAAVVAVDVVVGVVVDAVGAVLDAGGVQVAVRVDAVGRRQLHLPGVAGGPHQLLHERCAHHASGA